MFVQAFRRSLWLFACLLLSTAAIAQAQKRPITEKDIFDFVWIGDPQISPDGSRVAYVLVTVNEKKDGYDTAIWSVPTAGGAPSRLTTGPRDTSPRWSPDGQRLLFLRAGEKDGKPQPAQLHILPLSGGEAWALTSLPRGAESPVWSPDGKSVAFLSRSNPDDLTKAARESRGVVPERESDVRVITRAVYRFNGTGYLDLTRPTHLWVTTVPQVSGEEPQVKQLTSGRYNEQDPVWSPDGRRIYYSSTRITEPYYDPPVSTIFAAGADGSGTRQVLTFQGSVGNMSVSPDGKQIAFRGSMSKPVLSYNQTKLWVAELSGSSAPRDVAPQLEGDVAETIAGDQHAPRGRGSYRPQWSADGRSLFDTVGINGATNLYRFPLDGGKPEPLTTGKHEVIAFTTTSDWKRTVVHISTPTSIGDLFALQPGGKLAPLTNTNEVLFSQLRLTEPEEIWYTSFDGKKIHGLVQRPPDFDPAKKYPLILNIHGGPHSAYGFTFFHEMQWMAAKGYVVLYPNPRGSSTYGQDFGNIIQYRYPGDDHKDLMAGVDELIRRGYVDEKRLGITGGSGGGVLTNWAISQTNRFAAAVSQRSIADWAGFWYTADFTLFTPSWFRGAPWEQRDDFAARSPITHIAKVETPLMLIEGEADLRTPPSDGGEQMFRALKFLRKPTVMVRFPDETHELSRSGKPWHRVERLQHIVNWFDKYLMGKSFPQYEIEPDQPLPQEAQPAQQQPPRR